MSLLDENRKIGYQSLAFFLVSFILFSCVYMTEIYLGFGSNVWGTNFWSPILYLTFINLALRFFFSGFLYDVSIQKCKHFHIYIVHNLYLSQVSVRATFLGCTCATGLYASSFNDGWSVFGIYAVVMSVFHFSEFFTIALTNPLSLSLDSFILNHSRQYITAAITSWIEWTIEFYFFPGIYFEIKPYSSYSYR